MDFITNLEASLRKGFIDKTTSQYGSYKPALLVNEPKKNVSVLTTLVEELRTCETFAFSVAFITESGLAMLKSHLLDLKLMGVKGRILTSTFLSFNQPKLFRELLKISNIEVRIANINGFHSKGYIFKHKTHHSLIIGSSNLTAQALRVNYEWNIKLTSFDDGEIVYDFAGQFESLWHESQPLGEEWIHAYETTYAQLTSTQIPIQLPGVPALVESPAQPEAYEITPNKMQQVALQQIQLIRDQGKNKGLIISATGTGKTYLSAFDVRNFNPKRMLFVVHREQILNKAKSDFIRILGKPDVDFGILSGTNKQTEVPYVFATIQSISKDEILRQFDPESFDYILIDEVHKAGAKSYQKVIEHFKPRFFMGMTATPERTDDFNIYELFDYNIAYEIRLQEALEEDMLCPFHYFGVTDLEYEGELTDDTALITKLVTEERVNHVIEKIEYYGFSGTQVQGLIFVSRKDEAEQLSSAMNTKGYRTVALTGDDSQDNRTRQVERLENGVLDYIITVDIFNEGIDIPSVNQVVMLRQTQSSIIFIQQLGRGLRKHASKEFVTIIDFIGNYKNNYLIPIALSGDKSLNKDNIRRRMKDTSYIKGISTVNFEAIAQKYIFKAISDSNLSELKQLKEAYTELRDRIGRVPYLYDFIFHNSIDPVVIANKYANYHEFLVKVKEPVPSLTEYENKVLTMLSVEVLNGKRQHEILLLEQLVQAEKVSKPSFLATLREVGGAIDEVTIRSVEKILNLKFFTDAFKTKYGSKPLVVLQEETYRFNETIRERLQLNPYFKHLMMDIIESAKEKSKVYDGNGPLTLYEKYTRKDACKLLNWASDESNTVYGYKTKFNTCPIFITYHKHDEVDSSIDYSDEFVNQDIFKWSTRSNRTLQSEEVRTILEARENQIDLHMFVKKDDDEGGDFYYLGKAFPDKKTAVQTEMKDKHGKDIPVVHMNLIMEQTVESKLYHYLISRDND